MSYIFYYMTVWKPYCIKYSALSSITVGLAEKMYKDLSCRVKSTFLCDPSLQREASMENTKGFFSSDWSGNGPEFIKQR